MANIYCKNCKRAQKNDRGFSLVELIVVMVIVAILATGVVTSFTNPIAKVKAVALEVRGDFNLAKSESVKENQPVLMDFILGAQDGYQICFEISTIDGDCGNEAADDIIKEVTFRREVQFYDFADGTAFPSNGPQETPNPNMTALDTAAKKDGIVFIDPLDPTDIANNIIFSSNGTTNKQGAVIIYFPADGDRSTMRGNPYAAVIENVNTGKVTLSRWRPEIADDAGTPYDDRWSPK